MSEREISCLGETCVTEHIVKFRSIYNKTPDGEIFVIKGDNELGKKELLQIAKFMGVEVVEVQETDSIWTIKFRKKKDE